MLWCFFVSFLVFLFFFYFNMFLPFWNLSKNKINKYNNISWLYVLKTTCIILYLYYNFFGLSIRVLSLTPCGNQTDQTERTRNRESIIIFPVVLFLWQEPLVHHNSRKWASLSHLLRSLLFSTLSFEQPPLQPHILCIYLAFSGQKYTNIYSVIQIHIKHNRKAVTVKGS